MSVILNKGGVMKVFVTGVGGQLGYDLMKELGKRHYEGIGSDLMPYVKTEFPYIQLDITNASAVDNVITEVNPDIVIHCAAWTDVDSAEEEDNRLKVKAVNVDGTRNIVSACKNIDCKLIYISTDYVFNGLGNVPWKPDYPIIKPLNYYGQSKLDGEFEVSNNLIKFFVVRTSWAFGVNGKNFVEKMLDLSKTHSEIKVVSDQIGTPTYTRDLSMLLLDMAETEVYGFYHASNGGGYISWYDFSIEIFRQARISITVTPVTTEQYGHSKALRPLNSRLDCSKLIERGFISLPNWQDALYRYLKERKKDGKYNC